MDPRATARAARSLALAERAGPARLARALDDAAGSIPAPGLDAAARREAALALLAVGLRGRGLAHADVAQRLGAWTSPGVARSAALRGAALARALWPAWTPQRLAAARRRAAVVIFLAFATWGALGVAMLAHAGR